MPQATSELTKEWDGPSDYKAHMHLTARGFTLRGGIIKGPKPTEEDERAILFLIQEWDYDYERN